MIRALLRGLLAALGPWVLAGCATKPAEPPVVVGSVWEVRRGESVGHLVASMHSGVGRELVLSDRLKGVIAGAGVVAFESLPAAGRDPRERPRVIAIHLRGTSESLESELGPELTVRVRRVLDDYLAPAGAWESLSKLRLPFVTIGIAVAAGMGLDAQWGVFAAEPTTGLDELILQEAKRAGRALGELEHDAAINRSRIRLTREEAVAEIGALVRRLESMPRGETPRADGAIVAPILAGDVEGSYAEHRRRYCSPPPLDRVCDKTGDDRNDDMATRFEALLAEGNRPLGVTGAHHLAGPSSILVHLARRGYGVKRLDP